MATQLCKTLRTALPCCSRSYNFTPSLSFEGKIIICKYSSGCFTRNVKVIKEMNSGEIHYPTAIFGEETQELESKWKKRFLDTRYRFDAIFILGPMGTGKTTVINNEFKNHPIFGNYAYVDTDEIMGMLQGFASNKVVEYYPIARNIAIRLTDWILEQKISFVAEGTCVKYMELIDYMHRLKSVGYQVRVKRLPRVPLETVVERAKLRKNRIVPDHVVRAIHEGSNLGVEKLYEFNKKASIFVDMDLQERNEELGPTSLEVT